MVKAMGEKNGKNLTVEYNGKGFTFNGKDNYSFEAELEDLLEQRRPIGGTYFAEDSMEEINIINVLSNLFFDRTVDVESDTEEELPREEGLFY